MSTNETELLLIQASALTAEKKYKEALEKYNEVLKSDSQNLEALKNSGINYFLLDDIDKALDCFIKFKNINEDDATVRYYIGSIYTLNGEMNLAIDEFKKVISLREEYIDAYRSLAMIYISLKNNNAAIEVLKQAILFDDKDPQTIKLLASAYLNNQEDEESFKILQSALEKGIENPDIYNMLGSSFVVKEQPQEGLIYFQKALELKPDDYTAIISSALIYGIMLDFDKAIEYHKKALELFPTNMELQINAAIDWYVNGYLDEAKQLMLEVLKIDPNEARAMYQIALIYHELYDYDNALLFLKKIAQINHSDVISLKMAEVYADMREYDKAYEIMDKLIKKSATEAEYYYKYAIICTKAKDTASAEKYFKKFIALKGDDATARKDLAVLYISTHQMDYAKEEFEKAYELAPEDPWVCFEYGNFFFLEGNYQKALELYNKAIQINPLQTEYFIAKAVLLNKIQKFDEAINILKPIADRQNKHPQVLYTLAWAYLQKDDLIESKKVLENYIHDGRSGLEMLNLYVIVLDKLGEYEEDLKVVDIMLAQNPNNMSLMLSKAKYLGKKGDVSQAEETYLTVLSILPEYEDAITGLLSLYKENGLIPKAKDFIKKINADSFSDQAQELIKSFE